MFLLVDNYDSFSYNLYALFRLAGAEVRVVKNDLLIEAGRYQGIIISPGPSTPENAGYSLEYLKKYAGKKPFFGVCLGLQCIGRHLGYEVGRAASVMHGKADRMVRVGASTVLDGLPETFSAVRYHSLAVKADEKRVTARAGSDNELMALEDKEEMLFGVQFHPESVLSEHGAKIADNFMKFCGGR
jgi:anthranilate synthase component 2